MNLDGFFGRTTEGMSDGDDVTKVSDFGIGIICFVLS